MNQSCFLSPIHPPKFQLGIEMLESYSRYFNDDHFFLVFSSEQEASVFKQLASHLKYRSIVCNEQVSNSPTTLKKFHGVREVYATTDFKYCAAIDVDVKFFKHMDYDTLFEEYYQRGIVYGNDYEYSPFHINHAPTKFFNNADVQLIASKTENFRAYFWFNDIPIYERTHFSNFLNYINFDHAKSMFVWADFDYIVYIYYMLIIGAFTASPVLVDGEPYQDILVESQMIHSKEEFIQAFTFCNPMWINCPIEDKYMKNAFIRVHTDKRPFPQRIIAHRGLLEGPNKELENNPSQIMTALDRGYECEIDVWLINDKWMLGHDGPTYEVSQEFLLQPDLWIHAKNSAALFTLSAIPSCNVFWHDTDKYTMTSKGFIWAYPGQQVTANTINVLPEWNDPEFKNVSKHSSGVCTDYPIEVRYHL